MLLVFNSLDATAKTRQWQVATVADGGGFPGSAQEMPIKS